MEGHLIHAFMRRKYWRMTGTKNKLTSPSQTFPIALKLSKSNNKAKKSRYALGRLGIKKK